MLAEEGEALGDLGVGQAAGDEGQDLGFALGQAVGRRCGSAARPGPCNCPGPRPEGRLGFGPVRRGGGGEEGGVHLGAQDRQAAGGGVQCPGDVGAVGVLGEVAARAGPQGVQDGPVVGCADVDE